MHTPRKIGKKSKASASFDHSREGDGDVEDAAMDNVYTKSQFPALKRNMSQYDEYKSKEEKRNSKKKRAKPAATAYVPPLKIGRDKTVARKKFSLTRPRSLPQFLQTLPEMMEIDTQSISPFSLDEFDQDSMSVLPRTSPFADESNLFQSAFQVQKKEIPSYSQPDIQMRVKVNGDVYKSVECPAENAFADYYVQKFIGNGVNGTVWLACSKSDLGICDRVVRVSFEDSFEKRMVATNAGELGIGPKVFEYTFCTAVGEQRRVQLGIMSRLDTTLEEYLIETPREDWDLKLDSILMRLFEETAEAGIINHDCKPDNIMLNLDPINRSIVTGAFMIDFDFAYMRNVHPFYGIATSMLYGFNGWPRVVPQHFVREWDRYCMVAYMTTYTRMRKALKENKDTSFSTAFPELFALYRDLNMKNPTLENTMFQPKATNAPLFIDIDT